MTVVRTEQHRWLVPVANLLGQRYTSFSLSLRMAAALHGEWSIVETGSLRKAGNWEDGQSTVIFARFAAQYGRVCHTVDTSVDALQVAKTATKQWDRNMGYHNSTGVDWLLKTQMPIGLLYLDSLDAYGGGDPHHPTEETWHLAQEEQMHELEAAWPSLISGAIVLLDDHPAKTKYSINLLRSREAQCFVEGQQSGWRIQ